MDQLMILLINVLINILIKHSRIFPLIKNIQGKEEKKRVHIERNREECDVRLWNDYFSETPAYPQNLFRRRFRMNKPLLMHIVDRLSNEVHFIRQKKDCLGRLSLSPLQKCIATIRVLAYGTAADTIDECLQLGATTTQLGLEKLWIKPTLLILYQ